jgi:hypothetical protein
LFHTRDQESPKVSRFQAPRSSSLSQRHIFPALSEPCSRQSMHHPSTHSSVPPHLSHFQPPNRVHCNTVELSNWKISFGIPNASYSIIASGFPDILCCAWLLRGQKPAIALGYECCTVTGALDHFTPFHWDLESNRPYSYGAHSVSPIQKIFTCASPDAIFHRSIV